MCSQLHFDQITNTITPRLITAGPEETGEVSAEREGKITGGVRQAVELGESFCRERRERGKQLIPERRG